MITDQSRWIDGLTFVVFAFNEERRLPVTLANLRGRGRVLVVDNYSTDGTVEVARAAGCDVLLNRNPGWVEDPVTAGKVMATVQTPWVYWGFTDELVSDALCDAIRELMQSEQCDVINVARKNYLYGRFCHDAYLAINPRVFRVGSIDFSDNTIHQMGRRTVPESRVHTLPAHLFVHHFISNHIASYLGSMARYMALEPATPAATTSGTQALFRLCRPLARAAFQFFARGGYKAGLAGANLCALFVIYEYARLIKLGETRLGIDADNALAASLAAMAQNASPFSTANGSPVASAPSSNDNANSADTMTAARRP